MPIFALVFPVYAEEGADIAYLNSVAETEPDTTLTERIRAVSGPRIHITTIGGLVKALPSNLTVFVILSLSTVTTST